MGTNSVYPDGNIPYDLKDNEEAVKVHDDSLLVKEIMEAFDYDLTLDKDNKLLSVNVKKTKNQWEDEQPKPEKKKTTEERLKAIEKYLGWEV